MKKERLETKYHRLRAKLAAFIATNKALKRKINILENRANERYS